MHIKELVGSGTVLGKHSGFRSWHWWILSREEEATSSFRAGLQDALAAPGTHSLPAWTLDSFMYVGMLHLHTSFIDRVDTLFSNKLPCTMDQRTHF